MQSSDKKEHVCRLAFPPTFDPVAAQHLSAEEVRRRWPRTQGTCLDGGATVLAYASFEHYIAGDW